MFKELEGKCIPFIMDRKRKAKMNSIKITCTSFFPSHDVTCKLLTPDGYNIIVKRDMFFSSQKTKGIILVKRRARATAARLETLIVSVLRRVCV